VYVDDRTPVTAPPLGPAVDAGARKWESQLFYREVSLRRTESVADADVVVHYDVTPPLVDSPAGCDRPFIQAAAATFFCPTDDFAGLETLPLTGGATPGHVKMEVIVVASRIADQAQLDRVVAHEIGHVFGIGGHSGDPADLMYPAPEVDAPSAADGRSLRYALHQPGAVTP
jgi:predicted Zn-dependent protease